LSETNLNFEEYLLVKKIDALAMKNGIESKYEELESVFNQTHPKSFTDQYLFLINGFRRMYPLKNQ
jgi:hypothetical protein